MTIEATNTIITLFILAGFGFVLKKLKVTDQRVDSFISTFLVSYIVPVTMFHTAFTSFTLEHLKVSWKGVLLVITSMVIVIIISSFTSRLLKHNIKRGGAFIAMSTFSNTIFVGLPIITGLFGDEGVPYLLLYYMANTVMFWTAGNYLLSRTKKSSGFSFTVIKKLLNPAILGFLLGLAALFMDIAVPDYIIKSTEYLKDMLTPLSLIYMGSIIGTLTFKNLGNPLDTILIILFRFAVSPLVVILLFKLVPMPLLMQKVFIISAALPVMGQVSIVSGKYGGDSGFAAFMTAFTTFLSLFTIPLYFMLFTLL
ncbi:AEC family transporter [Youngiibacter multivorans]|uniref:Permease n=1 Tax=Youngiibacter multivorans TaxID=937251 RepID=A0ABS4G550_9CLOT|nr:AEC family transporter [Youngiibacter multivorans]MBP1919641.1 putative permease [Youngiibacter multivorans]